MADLEPQAAAAGVTATVVVQTVAEPGETPELLALAAGNHLIAGVVGWVDLASPGVADAIAALRERPGADWLAGFRYPVLADAKLSGVLSAAFPARRAPRAQAPG